MSLNRRIILVDRPTGMPRESDFRLIEGPIPTPGSGEVLVRGLYLSLDPYMRGRMNAAASYAPAVELGDVMVGGVVGRVVESHDPRFVEGEIVEGMLGWQEYAAAGAKTLRKIDPQAAPITTALHVLGMPGLTAYFGLLEVCRPQAGETVLVSGAAGAVGSLVGQIAKIKRCRVVGIAGSDDKLRYLTEIGYDAGFNYKTTTDYEARLKELCPSGVDVYFDNVGGRISDAVMRLINKQARIAVCGQISQYNLAEPEMGPRWMTQILVKQAKVEGFLVFQWADRYGEGLRHLAGWLRDGRIRCREDIAVGLENAPRAFIGMLGGANKGKQLVKL